MPQSEWHSTDREADLAALSCVIDVQKTIETSESFDLVPFWASYWNKQATPADFAAFNEVADPAARGQPRASSGQPP